MRAWKNLKPGDEIKFKSDKSSEAPVKCRVIKNYKSHVMAESEGGILFWIDEDTKHLFRR